MTDRKGSQLPPTANPQAVDLIGVDRKEGAPKTVRLSTDTLAPMSHVGAGGAQHAEATSTDAGFMSAADKTKLDGIAAEAAPPPVTTVFGRIGAIDPQVGDYAASDIENDTTVPGATLADAMESLAASSPIAARQVATTNSLTGGGDLSADRTLQLTGDTASPGANRRYGTNAQGQRGWLPDAPMARASATVNPASPYAPAYDGLVVPITINDGRVLVVDKPTGTPAADIDECVLTIACAERPCVVRPGTWDATDGAPGDWNLEPGDTLALGFYRMGGKWTLRGHPIADDHRLQSLPSGFGLTAPARLFDVLANLHQRIVALETAPSDGGPVVGGVTSLNGLTGAVRLLGGANVSIDDDTDSLTVSAVGGGITTITAAGVTATPSTVSFRAGAGLAIDPTNVADGVIKYVLAGDSGQTVTTTPALVYAAAPGLAGETTAVVDIMPATALTAFDAVGDARRVRLMGRIEFPATASGTKAPVLTVTVNSDVAAFTGPALAASTQGRFLVADGYFWRHDATTIKSLWHMTFSPPGGALADGGAWPSSMSSPAGHYLAAGPDVTVADMAAVTLKLGLSWSADAETKKVVAESIMIGRLGRDADTTQTGQLLLARDVPATDLTQTTPTLLASALTVPGGTFDKDGAAVEMVLGGYYTSTSGTPTLQLQAQVNGANTTNGAPGAFSVGNITGRKYARFVVFAYRASASTLRVKVTAFIGAQGTRGTLASVGSFAHDTSDLVTGLDFTQSLTLGLTGAWSVATGTPTLHIDWRHARRVSDQTGRFVGAIGTGNVWKTSLSTTIPAGTLKADGTQEVLRTLASVTGATNTRYVQYQVTVNGQAFSITQAVNYGAGGVSRSLDAEFLLTRVGATALRLVGRSLMSGITGINAFPALTFDPDQPTTVAIATRMTDTTPVVVPEYASLAETFGGGETTIS